MNHESRITIFTDGSSRGNPGPGGFGAIVIAPKNQESGIRNHEIKELGGREDHTTNNRMELRACIEALSFLTTKNYELPTVVYSDSSYVINGITKWVFGWQKNGWKTATKNEVENRDLWEELFAQTKGKKIEWKQVGGHVGVAGNERCDEIATAFADSTAIDLYFGPLENYPVKNILDLKEDSSAVATKSSRSSHSNAKAYSYVSMVEGKIETHKTWAECEARVKGKRAKYKKALSADDEAKIIAQMNDSK
jgi:ribonuclease HI